MKEKLKKISNVCKIIFGYGIMITLFVGGLTFFGYIAALIIGGEATQLSPMQTVQVAGMLVF